MIILKLTRAFPSSVHCDKQESNGEMENVRIELTTESDVFFHYTNSISRGDYPRLQQEQRFMVEYELLPQVLAKMLRSCVDDPETFICIFIMNQANQCGTLNFLQNLGYKFVELMSLQMHETPMHEVRSHIEFRYSSLRVSNTTFWQKGEILLTSLE